MFEVWYKIHRYFNAHIKAHVRQIRVELKSIKEGNKSINEYVLCVKAIKILFLAIRDSITQKDKIDSILDGFLEEYHFS